MPLLWSKASIIAIVVFISQIAFVFPFIDAVFLNFSSKKPSNPESIGCDRSAAIPIVVRFQSWKMDNAFKTDLAHRLDNSLVSL